MLRIWINITYIGTVIGLFLSVKTIIDIKRILKQLNSMEEDEIVPEDIKTKMLRGMKLAVIGISLTSISGIIRIFLK